MSPSDTGTAAFSHGLRCNAAEAGRLTVSLMLVLPVPAAMLAGENVAVAPDGSPPTYKSMAAGKVAPLGGASVKV